MAIRLDPQSPSHTSNLVGSTPLISREGKRVSAPPEPARAVLNSKVEPGTSRGSLVKRGVVLFAAALGVLIGGIAVWGAQRWRDERTYQAWRRGRPWASYPAGRAINPDRWKEQPHD